MSLLKIFVTPLHIRKLPEISKVKISKNLALLDDGACTNQCDHDRDNNPLSSAELREILEFTIELARKAGALMLEGSHAIQRAGAGGVGEKKNAVDLVTEYDVKVEDLVRGEIARRYPHFQFIGEESYSSGTHPPLTDVPTFCVDPIDGTTNFVHGFPNACISLGLIDQRVPVLGVIYNPFLDHLYTGALIAVEWGSHRGPDAIRRKSNSFSRLAGAPPHGVMAHALRSVGSAALNFGLVAQGAAGIVILQEAGGFVTGSKDVLHHGIVTEAILTGRRYLAIRGVAETPEESSIEVQKRIAREFYDTVEDIPLDE
ncbi:inositol monophosphatase [Lactifluus volemus]|nr:inositol monophosphatase [Lactifluus volemus]